MTETHQRILVVDDDAHNVSLMQELCMSLGYRVDTARSGEAALAQVKAEVPDLILLDVAMPRMDGFEVLQHLKADPATAEIAVIIVTAVSDIDAKVRGIELGADDYLTKPFKLFELQARIRAALQVRHFQNRLRSAEQALADQGAVDEVTGAGLFAHLHANLDYEVTRARRYGRPLAALFLSVDGFLDRRGQIGEDAGNVLLRGVCDVVRGATRLVDWLYRLDVEEFVVLLPETPLEGAVVVAERIREHTAGLEAGGGAVTVSIGVAAFPHPEVRGGEDLLSAAAEAMKAARRAGTGHVGRFDG